MSQVWSILSLTLQSKNEALSRRALSRSNVVNSQRTLKQDDLKAYLFDYNDGHESAIVHQVTNGKNGMPAFGAKLGSDDISDVAAYVESQSVKGWA